MTNTAPAAVKRKPSIETGASAFPAKTNASTAEIGPPSAGAAVAEISVVLLSAEYQRVTNSTRNPTASAIQPSEAAGIAPSAPTFPCHASIASSTIAPIPILAATTVVTDNPSSAFLLAAYSQAQSTVAASTRRAPPVKDMAASPSRSQFPANIAIAPAAIFHSNFSFSAPTAMTTANTNSSRYRNEPTAPPVAARPLK